MVWLVFSGNSVIFCSSFWCYRFAIWAPSSEFVSLSIPSWQILTAHAQPFRGARDLAFCLKVRLDSLLVWASSGGSGETALMRRLAWTFAACIGDKYKFAWRGPYDLWLLQFLEIFSSIFNMQYDDMKHLTALCFVKASNVTSRYYTDTEWYRYWKNNCNRDLQLTEFIINSSSIEYYLRWFVFTFYTCTIEKAPVLFEMFWKERFQKVSLKTHKKANKKKKNEFL